MGIDFTAVGNEPVPWKLDMDFDQYFRFSATDSTKATSTPVKPVPLMDVAGESYITGSTYGQMTILLFKQPCSKEGKNFSRRAEITVNNKRYIGCGDFLSDPRLNGTWLLDSIGNERQQPDQYSKGLPKLTLLLSGNRTEGHDGCNNFSGNMEVQGTRIRFYQFVKTQMACTSDKAGQIFATLLSNQIVSYQVSTHTLILFLADDSLLIFKKENSF